MIFTSIIFIINIMTCIIIAINIHTFTDTMIFIVNIIIAMFIIILKMPYK